MAARILELEREVAPTTTDRAELLARTGVVVASWEEEKSAAPGAADLHWNQPEQAPDTVRKLHRSPRQFLKLGRAAVKLLVDFYFWLSGPPMTQQARMKMTLIAAQIHLKQWD